MFIKLAIINLIFFFNLYYLIVIFLDLNVELFNFRNYDLLINFRFRLRSNYILSSEIHRFERDFQ